MTSEPSPTGPRPLINGEMFESTATDLTLADVLTAAAEEAGLTSAVVDAVTSWSAGSPATLFAVLTPDGAAFRLDPAVARAALRTPDTSPSNRGPDWVAFAPAIVD